jgi:transcriptional regulator with PAS, ATPase and Fis domain
LIGASPVIEGLRCDVEVVARSDARVLITGESGVGKELVAHAIHDQSRRAGGPFVAVNCAGIPETLLESELFGHTRGSFTGAHKDRAGKLEVADNGTILLDEVGEMTLRMQGLLLRFLASGDVQKIGADRASKRLDVRVIAATNRHLASMTAEGKFREDLYYRLNVVHITVPPLRARMADLELLVDHFLQKFRRRHDSPVHRISPDAVEALRRYRWPGNVRELENLVERLVVTGRSTEIIVDDLPPEVRTTADDAGVPAMERRRTVVDELYAQIIRQGASFWTVVYPLFMRRDITRENLRDLIRRGLSDSRGSYKVLARLFNMEPREYKRFLNFLRSHECQLSFHAFREGSAWREQIQV